MKTIKILALAFFVFATFSLFAIGSRAFANPAEPTGGQSKTPAQAADTESSPASQSGEGQVIDRIIVSIDGEGLTLSDLRKFIVGRGENPAANIDVSDPKNNNLLQEMVNEELLQREAKASGIGVGDEEISAYIAEVKKQNRVDEAGLSDLLRQRGMSFDEYRAQVERDIVKSRVVSLKVRSKINVLDSEIEEYYFAHPELASNEKILRIEQIFIPKSAENDHEELSERAKKLQHDAAEDPAEFADVWEEGYTDLGPVSRSDLRPELAKAIADLSEGGVSPVVEVEDGFYILRASIPNKKDTQIDETVKANIRRDLTQQRYQAALDRYLKEDLPRKYHVEYRTRS